MQGKYSRNAFCIAANKCQYRESLHNNNGHHLVILSFPVSVQVSGPQFSHLQNGRPRLPVGYFLILSSGFCSRNVPLWRQKILEDE